MSEKLETRFELTPFPGSVSHRPATRKHHARTLVVGTLISAGVFWASRHLCPTGFLGSGIPQSSITHAHTDDDLRNWITHEAQFGHRKIFDRELDCLGNVWRY